MARRPLFALAFAAASLHAQTEAQIRRAAERALKPIERSIQGYIKQRACFSCHHNGLAVLTFVDAREHGLSISPQVSAPLSAATFRSLTGPHALTAAIEGADLSDPTPNESLLLLAAAKASIHAPDTIPVLRQRLLHWQQPDGHWATSDFRPPHSSSSFAATWSALAALEPNVPLAARHKAMDWLLANKALTTEDAVFKILGLMLTCDKVEYVDQAATELAARQLPNGGWPQMPGYPADAYSTGEAVYALARIGGYEKQRRAGIRFLLATQAKDGTWRTRTRMLSPAHVSPPYFKTSFPYGRDEFLSFTGALWAVRALSVSLPSRGPSFGVGDRFGLPHDLELLRTALFGSRDALRDHLDHGDRDYKTEDGITLLMASAHDEAKVRLLLSRGADPKARSHSGTDALTIASGYRDNAATLAALLDAGAEPNLPGNSKVRNSPLVLASMTGDLAMVKLLLSRGADPNASSRANTPLSAAATFGHADVVEALLAAGADAGLTESTGINLLHWAAITNRPALVPLLAKSGVPINAEDENGFTPLHYAASIDFGETKMIEALLAAGANPALRNFDNRTPLQQARHLRHAAQAAALRGK